MRNDSASESLSSAISSSAPPLSIPRQRLLSCPILVALLSYGFCGMTAATFSIRLCSLPIATLRKTGPTSQLFTKMQTYQNAWRVMRIVPLSILSRLECCRALSIDRYLFFLSISHRITTPSRPTPFYLRLGVPMSNRTPHATDGVSDFGMLGRNIHKHEDTILLSLELVEDMRCPVPPGKEPFSFILPIRY